MSSTARTALVTGASGSIGTAIATALAGRGYRVICAGRRRDRLDELCALLGAGAHPLALDVADDASIDSALTRLPAELRAIDALVNNAGHDLGGQIEFDRTDPDDTARVIAVNVTGLMRLTRRLLPGMLERDHGDVVNISSIASRGRSRRIAAYAASKHAVHGFTESLRLDYGATNLRFTEIVPGIVRSDFAVNRWRGDKERAKAFYDGVPACLEPIDVAECVAFVLERPQSVTINEIVLMPTQDRA